MTETLTIKIPYELASYAVAQRTLVSKYETNQLIKALDTWLVLKADAPGSFIQNWNKQKQSLLQLVKCSESIFRHRLSVLQSLKLLTYDRHHIRLCSWDQLAGILNIDIDKKLTIQYNIYDKAKLHQWIIAAEITDNQSRQAYMILKQVNKNPELNMILTGALIQYGADRNRLNDGDYFLSQLKSLYLQDFVQASDIHETLINIRPDTNRSIKGIAKAWTPKQEKEKKYKVHPTTVCYWKKVLKTAGIIDISKLNIESNCRNRNKHCWVIWMDTDNIRKKYPGKAKQQTRISLCDQITVLHPWLIEKRLIA